MMAQLVWEITRVYDDVMATADPRVATWFTMSSPMPCLILTLIYLTIVAVSKPLMANRKPFEIRRPLFVYNIAMVILSGYILFEFLMSGWFAGYHLGCQLVDYSDSPQAMRMASVCWLFYLSKNIELLDTLFFIMRKKFTHVTFLHVVHHGIMPLSWWWGVKLSPGGLGTFHATLNSVIHFLMYTYYALAALGPVAHKFLWWKKYMTSLQITQFIAVVIHSSQLLFTNCRYNRIFQYMIISYAAFFLVLFVDFYIKEYLHKIRAAGRRRAENGECVDNTAGVPTNGTRKRDNKRKVV